VEYRPRVVDALLTASLEAVGAVALEGPRACGKTETARRAAASEIRVDTVDARRAFTISPGLLLDGAVPRLLDEWQVEPDLWNYVRHAVDDRRSKGQFILTGSAVPRDDQSRHSGAGRVSHLRMRSMTLAEAGYSSGTVSLAAVLAGNRVAAQDPVGSVAA
jgi:predicted AAA+ superfamily ATPase